MSGWRFMLWAVGLAVAIAVLAGVARGLGGGQVAQTVGVGIGTAVLIGGVLVGLGLVIRSRVHH